MKIYVPAGAQEKERQDKTRFTTKIDGFLSFISFVFFIFFKINLNVNIEFFCFFFWGGFYNFML